MDPSPRKSSANAAGGPVFTKPVPVQVGGFSENFQSPGTVSCRGPRTDGVGSWVFGFSVVPAVLVRWHKRVVVGSRRRMAATTKGR